MMGDKIIRQHFNHALNNALDAYDKSLSENVYLLDADDLDIARLGATSGVDRFADRSAWSSLTTGEPVFHGVRAWARCAVISRMDAGASTVIAAQALQGSIARDIDDVGDEGGALVYHNRRWHRLGAHSLIG